ncbi:MAG: hypothetical protein ACREDR_44855, partial [Blastocatellia bacterium]
VPNACLGQTFDLSLQAGDRCPDVAGEFAEVPPLARPQQSRRVDTLAGGRQQPIEKRPAAHNALKIAYCALVFKLEAAVPLPGTKTVH